jgi:3-methyladenine DNA glycosylase AlkC
MYGTDQVSTSLDALYALTRRFSGEFAIRPLFLRDPDQVWARLAQWVHDPDPHVRRLVSEGSRPRLPWGEAIPPDPDRALPLLEVLIADPVEVVRRSAANHLNDLTRTHPERVLRVVGRCGPDQLRTVAHALRSLVKQGHPGALALLGVEGGDVAVVEVVVPPRLALGGVLPVQVALRHEGSAPANVWVDVVVGFPKAAGGHGDRVFRGGRRTLGPGEQWAFEKRLSLRPVTTRPNRLGTHTLAIQVNGKRLWHGAFELVAADPPSARQRP